MKYNRILIVGSPGSGKSRLSEKLAEKLDLPLIHLDIEYWNDDWVATPREEWRSKVEKMVQGEKWIIEGNYSNSMDIRFPVADLVIFLDINRFTCIRGVLSRHGKPRPDMPDGCVEKFNKDFLDFLIYVFNFPKKHRQKIVSFLESDPEKPVIIVKTRKEADELVENCLKIFSE